MPLQYINSSWISKPNACILLTEGTIYKFADKQLWVTIVYKQEPRQLKTCVATVWFINWYRENLFLIELTIKYSQTSSSTKLQYFSALTTDSKFGLGFHTVNHSYQKYSEGSGHSWNYLRHKCFSKLDISQKSAPLWVHYFDHNSLHANFDTSFMEHSF